MLRLSDSVAFVQTVPKLVAVFYELRSPLKSLDVSDGEMDFHEGVEVPPPSVPQLAGTSACLQMECFWGQRSFAVDRQRGQLAGIRRRGAEFRCEHRRHNRVCFCGERRRGCPRYVPMGPEGVVYSADEAGRVLDLIGQAARAEVGRR
jgi:hypothetical protein